MMPKLKKPKPLSRTPGEKLLLAVMRSLSNYEYVSLDALEGIGDVAFREAKRRRWISTAQVPKWRRSRYNRPIFALTKTGKRHREKMVAQQTKQDKDLLAWEIQQLGPCGFCGGEAVCRSRWRNRWACTNPECLLHRDLVSKQQWLAIGKLGRQAAKGLR